MRTAGALPCPEEISRRLLDRASISAPPIPLDRIVAIWKELAVVEENLDGAGYLLPLGRLGAEIVVNRNEPEERKRFTIAHELGHWVLRLMAQRRFGDATYPYQVSRSVVERWCDVFATNLLMPAEALRNWLPRREDAALVTAVIQGPARFHVSREAFFIRVWEVLRIQVAVMRAGELAPSAGLAIERSYASPGYAKRLLRLLNCPPARQQMQVAGEMISFALRSPAGLTSVSGRRMDDSRLIVTVAWPVPAPATPHPAPADNHRRETARQ